MQTNLDYGSSEVQTNLDCGNVEVRNAEVWTNLDCGCADCGAEICEKEEETRESIGIMFDGIRI